MFESIKESILWKTN